jgi:hypothetical protein
MSLLLALNGTDGGCSPFLPRRSATVWNERQAKRMPMLFSPTIGAAITAGVGFYGRTARPVGPPAMPTCERSIGTAARP